MTTKTRPSEAIFADGRNARPLALHPEAIGVTYPTRMVRDRSTYELRAMVTSDVADVTGHIAVLSIDGPLEHKSAGEWYCYWQTYEDLARDFKLVIEDPEIDAVVLKFDSPGGDVAGLNETVAILKGLKAASGKPVIGYVDESCYSAAYALAMVCDEIYLPESGGVGSIGVITAMADVTKMNEKMGVRVEVIASGSKKTDGHPCVPLTEEAIARTRAVVDTLADSFFALVAEGRGMSAKKVASFEAGTFLGQAAVDAGLADGVMSLADCLTFTPNAFSSSNGPTNRSADKEPETMTAKIAAAKAAEDAKKIAAAAAAPAGKVTKTKTVTTDTHEEEVDDGQPEEAEMPEDEPGDDGEDDGEEDAEKASASREVFALAQEITGKKKASHVAAALRGMAAQTAHAKTLQARVDKLEADARATKMGALVAAGMKAGKLAPAQRAWAMTQTPDSLKAFLDAAPSMVRTVDDSAAAHTEAAEPLSAEEIAMCASANPPVDPAKYAATKAAIKARSNGKGV